ncbi:MAG: hypothetical protein NZO58_09395, partial [Gemmataceae bacterium]|nr:hypothetical protein [Gemmataceae bacterium]
ALRADADKKIADAKTEAEKKKIEAKYEADKKKLEEAIETSKGIDAKKQHLHEAVRALTKALNLATSSTLLQKIDEARTLLIQAHYNSGDLERAAIAAEALGRTRPPTKGASYGIGVAFRAYDEIAARDDNPSLRERVRDLAEYVLSPEGQKAWANDVITSIAHHRLAMYYRDKKDIPTSLAHFEKIADDCGFSIYALGQMIFTAIGAAKDTDAKWTESERKEFRRKARAAIQRLPNTLPPEADASTAVMYFHARMEEAKFLYADAAVDMKAGTLAFAAAKYRDMENWVNKHYEMFKKLPPKFISEKNANELTTLMTVLDKYAKLGLADVDYRLGNYDKVLSFGLVGPVLAELREQAKKEGKITVKDHAVTTEVVTLALRTYVQKRDLDNAKLFFDILQRLTPESGVEEVDTLVVMFGIFKDVQDHLEALQKKGDQAKYQETLENYSKFYGSFLDSVVDQLSKKPRAEPREYVFLANAYMALKQPKKAAETFEKAAVPKVISDLDEEMRQKKVVPSEQEIAKRKEQWIDDALRKHKDFKANTDNPDDKARNDALRAAIAEEQASQRREYWYLQIQYAKALKENKEFNKAYRVLDRLVRHPLGEYHIVAETVKNEILEDDGKYGAAIKGWQELLQRLNNAARNDKTGQLKKIYFDTYFNHVRSWYKYSQAPTIKDDKRELALNTAARYIVLLENAKNPEGWQMVRERFMELLDAEPVLKKAYEKQKEAAKSAAK